MKLDITKTNIKYNNYPGLPFEIQFLKAIKEGHSCLRLLNPLTHLSCSSNFPRASITRYTHAKHEQILKFACNLKPISDIDECVVDTHHNCSSDAFCNNTHGSFNCTCKPGFTGDGEKCKGSIFSGMFVLVWQQKLYHLSLVISSCYNFLLIAMQRQGWMQGRWIGRLATSPFLSRLTGLLEQFNWHFFPVLCLISCTARTRTSFL